MNIRGHQSQERLVLKHLKQHGKLTPLYALTEYGCFRLAARIYVLRQAGHQINTNRVKRNGKLFAQYVYMGERKHGKH